MKTRQWAHPFDRSLKDEEVQALGKDPNATYGVQPSSDAIGGYFGMGWVSYFKDHETGEVYGVHCSDGVYGGKGSHHPKHEVWMHTAFHTISEVMCEKGGSDLSMLDWNLMSNYTKMWMDVGKAAGEAPGVVGTCKGMEVVVKEGIPPVVGEPPSIA